MDHLTYGVVNGTSTWIAGCNSLVHLDPVTTLEVDLASTTFNNALAQYENCTTNPVEPWPGFTSWFSGKLDELRVWNTAFPVEVIRQRMREGVYGYDNLVLHVPFEQQTRVNDGETLTLVEKNEAYSYAAWDGTSQVGSGGMTSGNDDSSLDQPNTFSAIALVPRGQTEAWWSRTS